MPKNVLEKEYKQPTLTETVVKTALKTLVCLILICVAIFSALFFGVPSVGYDFANRLGMDRTALFFADRYSDKNIDGLLYCVELDRKLLKETGDLKYASKLQGHTENFFKYNRSTLTDYFEKLDEYYLSNSPVETRVQFFSYYDRIVALNYVANVLLGEDKMIWNYKVGSEYAKVSFADVDDYIAVLLAFNQVWSIKSDATLPLSKNGIVTDFYVRIKYHFSIALSAVENEDDALKQLYMLRTCYFFAEHVHVYLKNNTEICKNSDCEWDAVLKATVCGQEFSKAYVSKLNEYIESQKKK